MLSAWEGHPDAFRSGPALLDRNFLLMLSAWKRVIKICFGNISQILLTLLMLSAREGHPDAFRSGPALLGSITDGWRLVRLSVDGVRALVLDSSESPVHLLGLLKLILKSATVDRSVKLFRGEINWAPRRLVGHLATYQSPSQIAWALWLASLKDARGSNMHAIPVVLSIIL
jgi:hypothetical protein